MKCKQLLEKLEYEVIQGSLETEISDIIYDSRKVEKGTAFVCLSGAVVDGHTYVAAAVQKGASLLIVEKDIEIENTDVTVIKVESTRKALGYMAQAYFGYPTEKLITIGLTGTKGKTTTSYMIQTVLQDAGKKIGVIGTIGAVIDGVLYETKNTTPESYELQRLFSIMVEKGCEYVVMEVSSQGLKMQRVAGIQYDYGIFTNFSPDHIGPNEHADIDEYLYCKSLLFQQCATGIFNGDDENCNAVSKESPCKKILYGCKDQCDLKGENIQYIFEKGLLGMKFDLQGLLKESVFVNTPGIFSVYNALCTITLCNALGIEPASIYQSLTHVQVKGRVELMPVSEEFSLIIDYAHNEVSTKSLLTTLKEYKPNRIICIFGCGGNRSKLRRYDMGEVAGRYADLSILTCDNPRDEEVDDINQDIKVGMERSQGTYIEIPDRKEAIGYALEHAEKNDMIVLIGKGHETYQEIKGVKYHYDEREAVAEKMLQIYGKHINY